MSELIERELANTSILVRDLMDRVARVEQRKTVGGIIVPPNVLPGPGATTISRTEYQRHHDALVSEIEGLRAEVSDLREIALQSARILDRMAGMEE